MNKFFLFYFRKLTLRGLLLLLDVVVVVATIVVELAEKESKQVKYSDISQARSTETLVRHCVGEFVDVVKQTH